MNNIAIVVIAYNRIESLKRLLHSLESARYPENTDVPLIISVDKSDSDEVEKFADGYDWRFGPKTVKKHERNLGLRNHILSQGKELDKYDAIVVLEDDIVVSPAFFEYAQQTIDKYYDNKDIAGISLYSFPLNNYTGFPFEPMKDGNDVFFINMAQSWGQIWMKNQWKEFEKWYKKNTEFAFSEDIPEQLFGWTKSWLKYHTRYCAERDKYFVYPYHSFSSNCGETGVHSKKKYASFQTSMQLLIESNLKLPDSPSESVRYDIFLENKDLYKALNVNENECCLNINGIRKIKKGQRYCLSTIPMPYRIIKSYGLSYHPIEYNVFLGNKGVGIWLYDLLSPSSKPANNDWRSIFISYHYRIFGIMPILKRYGLKSLCKDFFNAVKNKF